MPESNSENLPPQTEETVFFGKRMGMWGWIFNVAGLIALMGFATAFLWVMSSLPRVEGRIPARGMEYAGSITRNEAGVPFITARSGHDAYFAIGWIHAQDRLWQMEVQRRVGAGRLAEIVGEPGLKSDRFMRTLGLYRLAESSFDTLDESTQNALSAYAEGVNAWIADNAHRLPPEFLILGLRPETWKPADSLVWGRMMALRLTSDWRDEALRGKLATKLSAKYLGELWPDTSGGLTTLAAAEPMQAVLAALPEEATPRDASNVAVLSGKRSASGAPLLANDPHLPFQMPGLWYLASVEAPGLRLTGAMVPGIPFHLIGHNGRIAWGTTTTHADTVDLFVEQVAADGGYPVGKTSRPFTERQETILVKDRAPDVLTVRESRHGPIISDLVAGQKDNQVVALKSTALEPDDRTAQALYRLGRSVDWRSFVAALADFHAPVQNFAFADTTGAIGFITAGRVPLRSGKADGATPVAGWTGNGEWTGWVPFAKMPQAVNPKAGLMVNANNQVVGNRYPYRLTRSWHEGFRARRLLDLLEDRHDLTVQDMLAIQMDKRSLAAEEFKELLEAPEGLSPNAAKAAAMIQAWDGSMDKDLPEPLIYNLWLDKIWQNVVADELGDDFPAMRKVRLRALGDMLAGNRHWCDDVATDKAESCEDIIARSLESALADLSARFPKKSLDQLRWADVHQAQFSHPILSRIPLANHLSDSMFPTDGDDYTVSRGSFVPGDFTHVHGAGLRVVFDLSDLEKSRFIIAGGQSGNPLSRHYDDMMPAWLDNRALLLIKPAEGAASISLEPGY